MISLHAYEIKAMFLILVSATFTDNIMLSRFLGMCSCLGVSRKLETSVGLGMAVVFVTTVTTSINYVVYNYMLVPLEIEYMKLIVFITVIAAFVQFVEMLIERISEKFYTILGIFLPLITVNCAILGTSLFMITNPYNILEAIIFGFGSGSGWFLAIMLVGGIREKISESNIPNGLEGPGISLVIIAIMSMGFIGFSGMIKV